MGQSLDDAAMEHLQQQFNPEQQRFVLAGFNHFTDHLKSQLLELVSSKEKPEDYVVTNDDVQSIMAGFKR